MDQAEEVRQGESDLRFERNSDIDIITAMLTRTSLPPLKPEDVFFAWLIALPDTADVATAAKFEIEKLDQCMPLLEGPMRLRELMVQATKQMHVPRRRRQSRKKAH